MSNLHRTQILLESEQHQALAKIAEQEGRSISDGVREIVRDHLAERSQQALTQSALEAIEWLALVRARLQEEHGIIHSNLLDEVRTERDEDGERIWQADV